MKPQNYAARTAYRPPAAWYRRTNWLGVLLTSAGLAPRDAVTLQVRGRTSGKARRVPILRTRHQGADYLVALAGESQWVRNVRAADGRAIIRHRGARSVHLELGVDVGDLDRAKGAGRNRVATASEHAGSTHLAMSAGVVDDPAHPTVR